MDKIMIKVKPVSKNDDDDSKINSLKCLSKSRQ